MSSLQDTLKALLAIKEKYKNGAPCYTGICSQYQCFAKTRADVLQPYFRTWRHHSGSIEYPVPSGTKETPGDAYDNGRDNMFSKTTRYGRLRHNLLNHCIREVRRDIAASKW